MTLLNFGCGSTFHPQWVNLDTAPVSPEVIGHDLRRNFPFADGTFDAAYGSHVLEHLDRGEGARLVRDCYRVLKPGGIVRLAVPDLEAIARLYLASLEGAASGDAEAEMRYDWILLELYDQAVRTKPGGEMGGYLSRKLGEQQSKFVSSRMGLEGAETSRPPQGYVGARKWLRRGKRAAWQLRKSIAGALAFLVMGAPGRDALREGTFRRGGEIHHWMYDRFSLGRQLQESGFENIRVRRADESEIPGFAGYGLEVVAGRERKPDSLYIEARKRAAA